MLVNIKSLVVSCVANVVVLFFLKPSGKAKSVQLVNGKKVSV